MGRHASHTERGNAIAVRGTAGGKSRRVSVQEKYLLLTPIPSYSLSGIIVKNSQGYQYLTLASHGFPPGRELVYHPNVDGTLIGQVHDRLTNTDLALLRLSSAQASCNETFGARLSNGTTVLPQKVSGIRDPLSMRLYDEATVNNPFSGHCEGLHLGAEMRKVPSNDPVVEHDWVTMQWAYFGNGREEPMEGCGGSPVLDEDGNAVSFFRFLDYRSTPCYRRSYAYTSSRKVFGLGSSDLSFRSHPINPSFSSH